MFINEVPNSADLPAIIINELRDIYGIKYRKEKKLKNHQVIVNLIKSKNSKCYDTINLLSYSCIAIRKYLVFH